MEGKPQLEIESSKDITESIFLLKRADTTTKVSVRVDFSPPSSPPTSPCKENVSSSVKSLPVFNNDRKYYTPSFIVDLDKPKYLQNDALYLSLHHRKASQIQEEKSQIYVPKPSKTSSFCCICKQLFDDYLTHVNIPHHQQLMRQSVFHTEIEQLCSQFMPESQTKITKSKMIRKSNKDKKTKKKEPKKALIKESKQMVIV